MTFNEYIEKAKQYIREYLDNEFYYKDEVLDKEMVELDIRKIPMGYTTVTDDEIEIQAYVDLELMIFWREINRGNGWERLDLTVFSTRDQMLDFLDDFDFAEVYYCSGAHFGDIWAVYAVYEDSDGYVRERICSGVNWEGNKE